MRRWMVLLVLAGCGGRGGEACVCPMAAHGANDEADRCLCLPLLPATVDPVETTRIDLADGERPDWLAINGSLAQGPVRVVFAADGTWDERIVVDRTDEGTHRLVLDGGGGEGRAVVAGITTGFEEVVISHVTVRGFEITGSRDKGVFWQAGDEVLLEDLVVHDNRGTPAVSLNYANRTGHRSTNFSVRNCHIYNGNGEGLYIGGSEGEEQPAHEGLLIENNLIHDFYNAFGTKHDGINVKDRISDVLVRRNVVFHTDWGIEVASPGLYEHNLVFDVDREGFQVGDFFGAIADMRFEHNAVLGVGEDGFHLSAEHFGAERLSVSHATILGAGQAGVLIAGPFGVQATLEDIVVADGPVGFDGWDQVDATIDGCSVSGLDEVDDRAMDGLAECGTVQVGDWSRPAGPDNVFFTADDPWVLEGVGAQLPAAR